MSEKEVAEDNTQKRLMIHFKTREDELKGFEVLLDSDMATYATADNKYVINDQQCKMLKEKNIQYMCE